jgi:membrane-associated protease RseP (regulator of RpoE activity)
MRWIDFFPFHTFDRWTATFFIPLWLFVALALAIHEAAHAVVGMALGMRPKRVVVGTGPRRWRWHGTVHGVPVSIGPCLFFGMVDFGDLERASPPLRRIPMILAGPGANLAVGAAILSATSGPAGAEGLWHALLHGPQILSYAIAHGIAHPVDTGADPASALTLIGFVNYCGLLSGSLGLVNLAPFWPLDGGNVILAAADAARLGAPIVRRALVAIGIAGAAALCLPTLLMLVVPWRPLIGSLALGMLVGLAGRQWMWHSHHRWGTTPPPSFRQIAGLEPYQDERGHGDEGHTAPE